MVLLCSHQRQVKILRNEQFLKEKYSVSISHLWLSLLFSVLLVNFSQSQFPLQPLTPDLDLLVSGLPPLSFLPSRRISSFLLCFALLLPTSTWRTHSFDISNSFHPCTFQTSVLPYMLARGNGTGTHNVPLFWGMFMKTGKKEASPGCWTFQFHRDLNFNWFWFHRENYCRWYEQKHALPLPRLLPLSFNLWYRPIEDTLFMINWYLKSL